MGKVKLSQGGIGSSQKVLRLLPYLVENFSCFQYAGIYFHDASPFEKNFNADNGMGKGAVCWYCDMKMR